MTPSNRHGSLSIQRPGPDDPYERLAWRLAGLLVAGLFVIWGAGLALHASRSGEPPLRSPDQTVRSDATRPIAYRAVRFVARGPDFVAYDAETGSEIRSLGFERDGFIVSIVRSLDRQRRQLEIAADAPYRLTRWDNGQLLFEDPRTGTQIELTAFGGSNADNVARLLFKDGAQRR